MGKYNSIRAQGNELYVIEYLLAIANELAEANRLKRAEILYRFSNEIKVKTGNILSMVDEA